LIRLYQPLDIVMVRSKYVYLAGSMGKNDWQSELYQKLVARSLPMGWDVISPRPVAKPLEVRSYAVWEYNCIIASSIIAFWFSKNDKPDMGLFDLGRWSSYDKPLIIGIEKGYKFKERIEVDLLYSSPGLAVLDSLDKVADEIGEQVKGFKSE
jgi:hypothetical protein